MFLGWSVPEVQLFLSQVRNDAKKRGSHIMHDLYVLLPIASFSYSLFERHETDHGWVCIVMSSTHRDWIR